MPVMTTGVIVQRKLEIVRIGKVTGACKQVASGVPEQLAYEQAMSDIGNPEQLAEEFAKNGRFLLWDFLALGLIDLDAQGFTGFDLYFFCFILKMRSHE